MAHRIPVVAFLLLTSAAAAQQPVPFTPATPAFPDPPPGSAPMRSPAVPPASEPAATMEPPQPLAQPAEQQPAPAPAPAASAPTGRIFCRQDVPTRVAEPGSVPESYRSFLGIWSDAAWTPQLCAALIVENVSGDGTATITYAFGPIGSGNRTPGGILHGTGIVRDGELRFQNNDGSQYAFKPFYADLAGRLTTPQGSSYEAVFKKTY